MPEVYDRKSVYSALDIDVIVRYSSGMAQHRDPHFRPQRGQQCEIIGLSPDAERARHAWWGLYRERVEARQTPNKAVTRIDRYLIDASLTADRGSVRGELLQIAVIDAETRPVTDATVMDDEEWAVIRVLADATNTLETSSAPTPDADTCRHGVPYSNTCLDCEEDDL